MENLSIDHIVLTVSDIEKTCKFYSDILGMEIIVFGNNRKALKFGSQKINLHEINAKIMPLANFPTPGSEDICFITTTPINDIIKNLLVNEVQIIDGPVQRTGANGAIISIYIRDPDGNLVEISNYN